MNSANEILRSIRHQKAIITKAYNTALRKLNTEYATDMAKLNQEEKEWLEQFKEIPVEEIYENETRKYIKKPIIIEAYQTSHEIEIKTINGPVTAKKGDYILTDAKGKQYPCDKEIFEETYDEIGG